MARHPINHGFTGEIFIFSKASKLALGSPLCLLFTGYQGSFGHGYNKWVMKLTTQNHLVPRSRIGGPIFPQPHSFHSMLRDNF